MTVAQTIQAPALAPLLKLDRKNSLSLQEQIGRGFFNAIGSGVLPAGVRLPSSHKQADRLRVSHNTALLDNLPQARQGPMLAPLCA